jgi:hypothetical protein
VAPGSAFGNVTTRVAHWPQIEQSNVAEIASGVAPGLVLGVEAQEEPAAAGAGKRMATSRSWSLR